MSLPRWNTGPGAPICLRDVPVPTTAILHQQELTLQFYMGNSSSTFIRAQIFRIDIRTYVHSTYIQGKETTSRTEL